MVEKIVAPAMAVAPEYEVLLYEVLLNEHLIQPFLHSVALKYIGRLSHLVMQICRISSQESRSEVSFAAMVKVRTSASRHTPAIIVVFIILLLM